MALSPMPRLTAIPCPGEWQKEIRKQEDKLASTISRIALVALNSAWYQSNPALYCLRAALKGTPHTVSIQAYSVNDLIPDVLNGIHAWRPDIACFSAYIWNRGYLNELVPALKKLLPDCRIVIGGPEAPLLEGLRSLGCVLVDGPGEGVIADICADPNHHAGSVVTGMAAPLRDLPFPYEEQDFPELSGRLVYYEASRGCPYRCSYCLSATDTRNERRFALPDDTDRLYSELDSLVRLNPRTVKFVDRSFNAHPDTARAVWGYLRDRQPAVEFHFEIHPSLLDCADIDLLAGMDASRIRFEVGIQSTDDGINAACGRHSDWQRDKRMLTALRSRTGVTIHADLLCGLPGQSYASVLDSIDQLAGTHPHEIQLGMLKILPRTPMEAIAHDRGYAWMDAPPYQALATDGMDFNAIYRCQCLARIVNLYWNKQEFPLEWQRLLAHQPASAIFTALLEYHQAHGLALHSIAKAHRAEVFLAVTGIRRS